MKLIGIATRERHQAPMKTVEYAHISRTDGIEGDFNRKHGKRQITIMSCDQWLIACKEIEIDLPWTTRRANLLVEGVTFDRYSLGKEIQIGDVRLMITAETEPCLKMDQQHQGLRMALTPDWRGGVCCQVIQGGNICKGDTVSISSQ